MVKLFKLPAAGNQAIDTLLLITMDPVPVLTVRLLIAVIWLKRILVTVCARFQVVMFEKFGPVRRSAVQVTPLVSSSYIPVAGK